MIDSKPIDVTTDLASCGGKLWIALRLYSLQSPAPCDNRSLILLLAVSRLVVRFLFPYWQRSLLWPSVHALAGITTWLSWRCTTLARNLQSRSPYLPKKSRTSLTKSSLSILNKKNTYRAIKLLLSPRHSLLMEQHLIKINWRTMGFSVSGKPQLH